MVYIKTLLPELRGVVKDLAEDLLVRSMTDAESDAGLREAHRKIKESGRTAQSFEEWRDDYLDQVAVAWVLACVFVRFMEDNDLINERWIAGEGEHGKMAEGEHELFFRSHPHDTDREYLHHVFVEVRKIPAAAELFAEGKTPLWALAPSGDAAKRLLEFFQEVDAEVGGLKRSFATEKWDTQPIVDVYEKLSPQARFLGDLYQDLSEHARKKFALLQTPVFVEEFILDRTLTFALDEFGLDGLRMIDPACGSGHFLLGAFDRLFHEWMKPEHGVNNKVVAAQNALDGVWGVDINPFAVAITRFRLLVAVVNACGIKKLNQQNYSWKLHLATGDSLLWGSKPSFNGERVPIKRQGNFFEEVDRIYAIEELAALDEVLGQGYHVVVGNPPYITVKDKAQSEKYRELYSACHRQYSLGVPFTQRFWELAIRKGERINQDSETVSSGPGYVGMITANSFMKREFGKKLIEEFFPRVDLTHVLDTSGAHIPGHGTPTVILYGRSRKPVSDTVRAVLGIKGEPTTPDDPSQGLVWHSILSQIDRAGAEDEFTSTTEVPRKTFASHPWSIGGGGAADLKEILELSGSILADAVDLIGLMFMTRADDIYFADRASLIRAGVNVTNIASDVEGDAIRDWTISTIESVLYPYDDQLRPVREQSDSGVIKFLWPCRVTLWTRREPNGDHRQIGLTWYEWSRFQKERLRTPRTIAFSKIATHNHFVLDRERQLFNCSAPIIKLPADATEDDHLALLGLLNSSTACFWMKQVMSGKHKGDGGEAHADPAYQRFEFTGTQLLNFPIPEQRPLDLSRLFDGLGQKYNVSLPNAIVQRGIPTQAGLEEGRATAACVRGRMIALQEELDWECYRLYDLLSDDLRYIGNDLPEIRLGERAFEIIMARRMAEGKLQTTWFVRHGSTPITEIPAHWPTAYRTLVERRIRVIDTIKEIELIERPEYKRRWNTEPWEEQERRALKGWLLDRLESPRYWPNVELQSTAQLADRASGDPEFLPVAALYRGRPDFDVTALVAELVEAEAVSFLPVLRYKPSGLRKREVWERTWALQRKQDAGGDVGDIPVPPKYTTPDFLKNDYWRLRGKLDVPKERWISYPHLQTESDPSLVVGWAGWDHLQQATSLVAYYDARKREGWDNMRLSPLLAGLDQLLPWIHQWHPEIDPEFGDTAGQSYQTLLENDSHELGLTLDDIRNWQPPEKARKAHSPRKKKSLAEDAE
ncbi:BREX-2 system adenine-specific DNA-methyltransferase PglX [Singulisphaera acidiphila]|uniref:site-specific DNA-methyltransferase (adenine-specific) n=1 Tax=Singulisphaera acidiphila (strain ATCC BAA-1392 / DSM 18658 / VKM B-2454 / MOB10) TaxID=886293 RepID=L0DBV6_SINAD|nr:BREX-2 system adenine-specific DNA-methyltransferase PglX [Singulisphaera acidiphila]AGA26318.1 Eco57I restriction endonuclease [Singulisphaera acidiphila DSM 18658]